MTDTEFDPADYTTFLAELPKVAARVMAAFDTGTDTELDDALDELHDLDPHPDQPHGLSTFAGFLMLNLGAYTIDATKTLGGNAPHIGRLIVDSLALMGPPVDDEGRGRAVACAMYAAGLDQDEDALQAALDLVDSHDLLGTTVAACVDLCAMVARTLQAIAAERAQIANPN